MSGVYVNLSGREVDDALLKLHGMRKEEPKKIPPQLRYSSAIACSTDMRFQWNCLVPFYVDDKGLEQLVSIH